MVVASQHVTGTKPDVLGIASIQHALLVFVADAVGQSDDRQNDKHERTQTLGEIFHMVLPRRVSQAAAERVRRSSGFALGSGAGWTQQTV